MATARRSTGRRRSDRAAGIGADGRPLLCELVRRHGPEIGELGLRPKDVDPHGLAGVAVHLRRTVAAYEQGRIEAADSGAASMLLDLEAAAEKVEKAVNERTVATIRKAKRGRAGTDDSRASRDRQDKEAAAQLGRLLEAVEWGELEADSPQARTLARRMQGAAAALDAAANRARSRR